MWQWQAAPRHAADAVPSCQVPGHDARLPWLRTPSASTTRDPQLALQHLPPVLRGHVCLTPDPPSLQGNGLGSMAARRAQGRSLQPALKPQAVPSRASYSSSKKSRCETHSFAPPSVRQAESNICQKSDSRGKHVLASAAKLDVRPLPPRSLHCTSPPCQVLLPGLFRLCYRHSQLSEDSNLGLFWCHTVLGP